MLLFFFNFAESLMLHVAECVTLLHCFARPCFLRLVCGLFWPESTPRSPPQPCSWCSRLSPGSASQLRLSPGHLSVFQSVRCGRASQAPPAWWILALIWGEGMGGGWVCMSVCVVERTPYILAWVSLGNSSGGQVCYFWTSSSWPGWECLSMTDWLTVCVLCWVTWAFRDIGKTTHLCSSVSASPDEFRFLITAPRLHMWAHQSFFFGKASDWTKVQPAVILRTNDVHVCLTDRRLEDNKLFVPRFVGLPSLQPAAWLLYLFISAFISCSHSLNL